MFKKKPQNHKTPGKQQNANEVYTLGCFQSEMNDKQGQLHIFLMLQ